MTPEDAHVRSGTPLPRTLEWVGDEDGLLRLIDQTRLPERIELVDCRSAEQVWEAIRVLRVRGAPAIGVAAAFGLCLALRPYRESDPDTFGSHLRSAASYLSGARPTAVNLFWAVQRVQKVGAAAGDARAAYSAMLAEARAMAAEDAEVCRLIGAAGAHLVPEGGGVITHCNAGALATVAHGTALSVLYAAKAQGRRFQVFADETRPLLQGARLTAMELQAAGIDVTVLCDNAAGWLMRTGQVQMAIVGADRIAANGDTANKIGTYGLAVLARHHNIPFYVAAPLSTFDLAIPTGDQIPIEQRAEDEVSRPFGHQITPTGVPCWNPAFDVTPADLVTAIICERGVLEHVNSDNIGRMFAEPPCGPRPSP
jgi:methylthioribose-1-phosphate isomerase